MAFGGTTTHLDFCFGRQNCADKLQGDENHLRRKTHLFAGRDIKKTRFPGVFAYDALHQKLKT
jgi:hypothetical protein